MSRSERDSAEFGELATALLPHLYRRAYLLTASAHRAEDLTQTALANAFAAWWRVRRADDRASYVHGILLKAFLSDRRRRSSGEIPVAEPGETIAFHSAGSPVDSTERLVLLDALRRLGEVDRAVVVLRFWEDLSIEQTAAMLGLTSAAVRNRSLRALKQLREALSPLAPTAPKGAS